MKNIINFKSVSDAAFTTTPKVGIPYDNTPQREKVTYKLLSKVKKNYNIKLK
ncbi:hypothetical protein [Rodentibacter caecimuris]|uniref:hypothetical protein n=1 Tax=Rodentibacter caecimuris TaxID=1796644 RepID=UPI0008561E1E|nr:MULTISPECIES: hypothetical protein [Pasteurellaceae]AOF53380.1 hypothetical protein AC062_1287 [Pasteurellaceae bacterium NI1060]MCQ9124061.1 hypothetical protein [Rodentibacter heylii]MCR1838129.1 hypothetical protein [Pasteurella caecimuris]MCU0107477.1 hypothetical protein [Pasteurella caecimuris]MCX2961635.1 hypothetical protein [Rodentibacter heylii]